MQKTLNCNGILLSLKRPLVMAIVNLTPDSFYDGGQLDNNQKVVGKIDQVVSEGADIIDLGAMSSRPGATIIDAKEEWGRLQFAIDYIVKNHPQIPISIDTLHSEVAKKALDRGCHIINDITGGNYDQNMLPTVCQYSTPFIAMHMIGTPQNMVDKNDYPKGILIELLSYFKNVISNAHQLGMKDIIIDPGFGFAKNIDQNFDLLNRLGALRVLDMPMLVGISRKSMIYKTLKIEAADALNGTTALHMAALERGANLLRVHDVKEAQQAIQLYQKLTS